MKKAVVCIFAVLILAVPCAWLYNYECDRSAWAEVQAKLIRLRSGLKYESALELRSHLADTDAAVKIFTSESRVFPPDHAKRVQYAERAIDYISAAIDFQINGASDSSPSSDPQDLQLLEQFPDLSTFVARTCTYGQLAIDRKAAGAAAAQLGDFMLARAEGQPLENGSRLNPRGGFNVMDMASESMACSYQKSRN